MTQPAAVLAHAGPAGIHEPPRPAQALELAYARGLDLEPVTTSCFLSRSQVVPSHRVAGMAGWRERLFAALARNAGSPIDCFNIPTNWVIELGTRVEP